MVALQVVEEAEEADKGFEVALLDETKELELPHLVLVVLTLHLLHLLLLKQHLLLLLIEL